MTQRSKTERIEGTEKDANFFSNLEKKWAEERAIKHLMINNSLKNNHTHILNYSKKYYENTNIDHENNSFLNELSESSSTKVKNYHAKVTSVNVNVR